jgi:hypothetical protein
MVTLRILGPDSSLMTPAAQEMKVHPAMLMKTHTRQQMQLTKKVNISDVRVAKSKSGTIVYADSASSLLAPDSCCSRNEGSSGYVDENT